MNIYNDINILEREKRNTDDIAETLKNLNQIAHWANRQIADLEQNFSITSSAATILHHKLVRIQHQQQKDLT